MEHITNLDHKDCFSFNSPFGYLMKKSKKFIYKFTIVLGFPFVHVVEQKLVSKIIDLKKTLKVFVDKNKLRL